MNESPEGLLYDPDFISYDEKRELKAWLAEQQPLWEDRHASGRALRDGQERRKLLRPVVWLGGWQFACLNYYRTGYERHRVIEAEPFPPILTSLVERIEALAHDYYEPSDIPEGWRLNTCLINFYGQTLRDDGKWIDTARVGSHRDHEPGPVGSLSLGATARFEFTTGRRAGDDTVLKRKLVDRSMLLFGTPRWKKEVHHRVRSVSKKAGHTFGVEIDDFRLRRVNFTLRYVPQEYIHPYRDLPPAARRKIERYMRTLATTSPFFANALAEAESS